MKKIALITGITGQDGSYLAEFLLDKNYVVHGIIRRSSSFNTGRLDHIFNKLHLHYGDMADIVSLTNVLNLIKAEEPDVFEIYNLAAQSHVKVSFETPILTANIDAIGGLQLLEAIRACNLTNKVRVLQASSSEMFGKVQEIPQTELTPFYPRSPYGVAKVYGYWIMKNYREAYNMFICNSICFNHESLIASSPVIFKYPNSEIIDIMPIEEIVSKICDIGFDKNKSEYQAGIPKNDIYIWDDKWTKITCASGYPNTNKTPKYIISKSSAYCTTDEHPIIMADKIEKETKDIRIGDKVDLIDYPEVLLNSDLSYEEATLLGLLVGDGNVSETRKFRFTNKSEKLRNYAIKLWYQIGIKYNRETKYRYHPSKSVFTGEEIGQICFSGFPDWIKRFNLYNEDRTKKIPWQILNSSPEIQKAFLGGYNLSDGMKANKCVYEFRNFKTNSSVLASGLIFLLSKTIQQRYNINIENEYRWGKDRLYYSINILSNSNYQASKSIEKYNIIKGLVGEISQREIYNRTGISNRFIRKVKNGYIPSGKHYREKQDNEVKKIIEINNYDGFFYDLETESGTFHAGIGRGHIHNSPRRGSTFITRKTTMALGRILRGDLDYLVVGNLEARRDWGHAKDYVEGMWLMLQQDRPDDYVISTNEQHSVREFIEKTFKLKNIDIKWRGQGINEEGYDAQTGRVYIKINERYFRPTEVETLLGDSSKARTILGWKPKYTFEELIKEMIDVDCPE